MAEKAEPETDLLAELLRDDSNNVFDRLMDLLGDDGEDCPELVVL